MHLVFFDIDGTLISTGGAGGRSLRAAFSSLFEIEQPGDVPFSGRTDRGIANNLFRLHGIDDTHEQWTRLRDEYLRRLPEQLEACTGRVLPGVRQLVQALQDCDDVALGLLTGNVREGARIKLGHFGLFAPFDFGGFGDHHVARNDVAEEALQAGKGHVGEHDEVWVVGDTPLDVECARAIQAKSLAVATGIHDREELAGSDPHYLCDDLSDVDAVLGRLLS